MKLPNLPPVDALLLILLVLIPVILVVVAIVEIVRHCKNKSDKDYKDDKGYEDNNPDKTDDKVEVEVVVDNEVAPASTSGRRVILIAASKTCRPMVNNTAKVKKEKKDKKEKLKFVREQQIYQVDTSTAVATGIVCAGLLGLGAMIIHNAKND